MHFHKLAPIALAAAVASAQGMGNTANASVPVQNDKLTSFYTVLQSFGLLEAVNSATNVTILAPSNDALTGLTSSGVDLTPGFVANLISYHTLNGTIPSSAITNMSTFAHTHLTNISYANVSLGQVVEAKRVDESVKIFSGLKNNVTVIEADLTFPGGVIHIIDGVLTIPGNVTDTLIASNLTALAGASESLNLTTTLASLRDVTVFAPSNQAFQNIAEALTNAPTTEVFGILAYHIVKNTVLYSSLITNTTLTTAGGVNLTVQVIDGMVYVNNAKVINPDILFTGGVIHVIDSVLNPSNPMAYNGTAPMSSGSAGAFPNVTAPGTNVPFTSGVSTPTASNNAQATTASSTRAGGATSTGAANPLMNGAVGAAALFGGFAALAAVL